MESNQPSWAFGSSFALPLAADARLNHTDYTDDHIWELSTGSPNAPALTLQTRFGGRCGLASLVPMWQNEGRLIYETQAYYSQPHLFMFTPSYALVQARITQAVALTAEYWIMDSHAVGARYKLTNESTQPISLRLDMFAHVVTEDKRGQQAIITLRDGGHALLLGRLIDIEPVVLLEGGQAVFTPGSKASPKVGQDITLNAGETHMLRWVEAGLDAMAASLERAQFWLRQDWDAAFVVIQQAAMTVPVIETGDTVQDTAIAYSYHKLMQAFLRPTDKLPAASFVTIREPNRGWSKRGDGGDYDRAWNGQHPHHAYLLALAAAPVSSAFAQGIVHNFLATQDGNGSVDFKPGLAGQRSDMLCPPLLARLAWRLYEYTGDQEFLRQVYPGLVKFFGRWFATDTDHNQNGLPEWQDERQTGYTAWPSFAAGKSWAQGLDLRTVECPDLAAYLLSEAQNLRAIHRELMGTEADFDPDLAQKERRLLDHLAQLWWEEGGRYTYRDRDSSTRAIGGVILQDVRGDEEHLPALKLASPSRLIIRLAGGTGRAPRAALYLEGEDETGRALSENIAPEAFVWTYSSGTATSQQRYARIDRVRFSGLSRVYRITVTAADHTRRDINGLMPLLVRGISFAYPALTAPAHFWRASGVSLVSADDPAYDATSANGGGGVWPFFVTLLGEALLEKHDYPTASGLLKTIIAAQSLAFQEQDHFSEFYHADQPRGMGEADHTSGIVPLHLLMQMLGIHILSPMRVRLKGHFAWGTPVTVRQHGVIVHRTPNSTQITFANGEVVAVPQSETDQMIQSSEPAATQETASLPFAPQLPGQAGGNRVIIQVEAESD